MSENSELLERFRRGAELLAVTLTGSAGPESDFEMAPGKWTIRQILRHLADAEIVGVTRFRKLLAEDNPSLDAWDQDLWAKNLDYSKRLPKDSLDVFRRTRADIYELLKDLPDSVFQRGGVHAERGPLTIQKLLTLHAEHAESHARQVQQIRDQYKLSRQK